MEERIIATYLTLPQQPIYDSHFWGNLLASPTLDVHPLYPCFTYLFRSAAVDNLETAEAAGLSQEDEQHWPQYDRHR